MLKPLPIFMAISVIVIQSTATGSYDEERESSLDGSLSRMSMTDPVPGQDWLAAVYKSIAEREYQVSRNEVGLQAPNRAHNIRTYFDDSGIGVVDRSASAPSELLHLSLTDLGRTQEADGCGQAASIGWLDNVSVHNEGNRVELRREGITEWFINRPAGLEHGFNIPERLVGEGELRLSMQVSEASANLQGDHVVFSCPSGRNLEYGELHVEDANGVTVLATFEVPDPGSVDIIMRDRDATYPLTVDPLLTGVVDALIESNQAYARLGYSVSGAGDVNGDGYADVIVGAYLFEHTEFGDEGAAFVHHGSASGISTTAAVMLANYQEDAWFGYSVSGAGDVNGDGYDDVIVGSSHYTDGQFWEGAFYVYHGSASGVSSTATAIVESDAEFSDLGNSVSSAGDVNGDGYADVIVGASLYDTGPGNEGAAFVYHGSASGISTTAAAMVESGQSNAYLGARVSGAGDVNGDGYDDVIVGASHYSNGQANEGAAFVYLGSNSGISTMAAVHLEYNQAGAYFGVGVSGIGDVNGDGYADVIVGAPSYANGQTNEGAAFVYHGSPSGISNTVATMVESNRTNGGLGHCVSDAGDVNGDGYADVLVGLAGFTSGESNEGAAVVYHGSALGMSTLADALVQSNVAGASMGLSLSGAGDVNGDGYADVIVGAPFYTNGQATEGAVFVYHGGASSVPFMAAITMEPDQEYAYFGQSVSDAGDVNGDGFGDVIVGAYLYDNGQENEGAAFVFHGSISGIPALAAAMVEPNQAGAQMGWAVSGAGDVNGDGYADVIVGSRRYNNGQEYEGAAFVYHGSADGISTTAAASLESDQAHAWFGSSVSNTGDVNGDGFGDVIVGAYGYDGAGGTGAAFVYHGGDDGVSPVAAAELQFNQGSTQLPNSVSGAGDVNGDGYADVLVGVWDYDNGQSNEGAMFVYHGGVSGISAMADLIIESNQADWGLGWSVSDAGDVNGDGYADVIAGATGYDNGQTNEGAVFIYHGGPSGLSAVAATQVESNLAYASFGSSVSCAGDANGDGYTDVIVGAPGSSSYHAYVYHGGPAGISPSVAATLLGTQYSSFGWSLSGAGDVNGDGFGDVIVGAKLITNGQQEEGASYVYHGNSDGRPVLASQMRGGGNATFVHPWGLSNSPDDFQVRMNATHPEGRGRVKLEVEYIESGDSFDGVSGGSVVTSNWIDAGIGGVTLTETIPSLATNTLYRWRARVLYAPHSVTEAGITAPINPAHGPWRRLSGQSAEADIRIGGGATAVDESVTSAGGIVLSQNAPNPFNPTTRIDFTLPKAAKVRLSVFDVNGRLVATLAEGQYAEGVFSTIWQGKDDRGREASSGVYFARLEVGAQVVTRKMVMLR